MTEPAAASSAVPAVPAAPTLRRVAIDPLSRVEGHGKVTLLIDEHDHVVQARLHIVEFRGFEAFIAGRPYWEVPVMVQRLCGICPVSHHLAACKALDVALGAAPVPASAQALRRLMHHGQILQSHALHFFHLASPDLLFGFDAEATRRNIVGVAAAYPDTARRGVLLRKFGQEVIRATAGKRVHGTGAVPGGMNRHLDRTDQQALLAEADTMVAWAQDAVALVRRLHAQNPALYDGFGRGTAKLMSLVQPDGALELYDGVLRVRDEAGALIADGWPDQRYGELIEEQVRPWSYMKFPYLRRLGPEAGWYRVGPLARVLNCDRITTPRAEAERQRLQFHAQSLQAEGGLGVLGYHWARMVEMLHAAELIRDGLTNEALLDGPRLAEPRPPGQRPGEGVGVIEAPRGTLIHHYEVGDDDLVTRCNLIVSTTHNNQAMHEAVRRVAADHLDGHAITEPLLNHIEVAIRAFDPCLSCATHALGQMPLEVALQTTGGEVLDAVQRGSDGRLMLLARPGDGA